jgi:phosphate acetyltransferase
MDFLAAAYLKAKKLQKTIVLPETDDPRILKAAEILTRNKLCKILLIGNPDTMLKSAAAQNINLATVTMLNPRNSEYTHPFSQNLYARRKHKGLTLEAAAKTILNDNVYFGCSLVNAGLADGLVTGANHATSHTIQATVHCVGVEASNSIISSFFVMLHPDTAFGAEGILFYADCGVNPDPTAEELAEIALQTANSFNKFMPCPPRMAMLSFSTKGSAKHPAVEKVIKATAIVKQRAPHLHVDGELQVDAALIPEVAKKKAKESAVAGQANILIFPDLTSGNIAYKLTERLGKAIAIGPILQGCAKPINDLSRGCSVDDVVNVAVITSLQAA